MFLITCVLLIIFVFARETYNNSVEGDWVDTTTGEHFVVTHHENSLLATSTSRSVVLRRAGNTITQHHLTGAYSHRGCIDWNDGSRWLRYSSSTRRSFWNYVNFRNFITPVTLGGMWFGESKKSVVILQLTFRGAAVSGVVQNGDVTETLKGEITGNRAVFETSLHDTLHWTFDDPSVSTLKIGNEHVLLYKLDT